MTDRRTVAVIGEEVAVAGYALAGAVVLAAEDEPAVRERWAQLTDDVGVVVLTATAAGVLGSLLTAPGAPLTVVMPS